MTCRVENGVTWRQTYNAENRLSKMEEIVLLQTEMENWSSHDSIKTEAKNNEKTAQKLYPNKRSMVYRMSDEQMAKILAFGSDWSENWF